MNTVDILRMIARTREQAEADQLRKKLIALWNKRTQAETVRIMRSRARRVGNILLR